MKRSEIKTQLHHWWPKALSKHWTSSDGKLSTILSDGHIIRAPAGKFGAITNAHHVLLDDVWSFSFEEQFNEPDNHIHDVIDALKKLKYKRNLFARNIEDRINGENISDSTRLKLAKIISSLIARSPRTRDEIRATAIYYRKRFNMENPEPNDALISGSQSQLYKAYLDTIYSGGRWGILFSEPNEFIAGDGFLNSFPSSPDRPLHPKCLIPLTPDMAVIYDRPLSYRTDPKIITLHLSKEETDYINYITQVYSKKFLFFRDNEPEILDTFSKGTYFMFKHHSQPWVNWLFHCVSNYVNYGSDKKGKILNGI